MRARTEPSRFRDVTFQITTKSGRSFRYRPISARTDQLFQNGITVGLGIDMSAFFDGGLGEAVKAAADGAARAELEQILTDRASRKAESILGLQQVSYLKDLVTIGFVLQDDAIEFETPFPGRPARVSPDKLVAYAEAIEDELELTGLLSAHDLDEILAAARSAEQRDVDAAKND